MRVYKEITRDEMEFWSGGQDTVEELTDREFEIVWDYLESAYSEMEESEINEFFWFERDFIAELLGYEDFDEILERNRNEYKY